MKYSIGEKFRSVHFDRKVYTISHIYNDSHNSMAFDIDGRKSDFMCSEESLDDYLRLGTLVKYDILPNDLFKL